MGIVSLGSLSIYTLKLNFGLFDIQKLLFTCFSTLNHLFPIFLSGNIPFGHNISNYFLMITCGVVFLFYVVFFCVSFFSFSIYLSVK